MDVVRGKKIQVWSSPSAWCTQKTDTGSVGRKSIAGCTFPRFWKCLSQQSRGWLSLRGDFIFRAIISKLILKKEFVYRNFIYKLYAKFCISNLYSQIVPDFANNSHSTTWQAGKVFKENNFKKKNCYQRTWLKYINWLTNSTPVMLNLSHHGFSSALLSQVLFAMKTYRNFRFRTNRHVFLIQYRTLMYISCSVCVWSMGLAGFPIVYSS